MKTTQAQSEAITAVETILKAAGIIDGLSKTPEEIKSEKEPMYWQTQVPSQEASKKDVYVTYNIDTASQFQNGDGGVIARKVEVRIDIWSRKRNNLDLATKIDDEFDKNNIVLEMNGPFDYDQATKLYRNAFITYLLVSDSDEEEGA